MRTGIDLAEISDSPRTGAGGNCKAYSIRANVMLELPNVGDGDG